MLDYTTTFEIVPDSEGRPSDEITPEVGERSVIFKTKDGGGYRMRPLPALPDNAAVILTEKQLRRYRKALAGKVNREIGRQEGVSHQSISDSITQVRKKIKEAKS